MLNSVAHISDVSLVTPAAMWCPEHKQIRKGPNVGRLFLLSNPYIETIYIMCYAVLTCGLLGMIPIYIINIFHSVFIIINKCCCKIIKPWSGESTRCLVNTRLGVSLVLFFNMPLHGPVLNQINIASSQCHYVLDIKDYYSVWASSQGPLWGYIKVQPPSTALQNNGYN